MVSHSEYYEKHYKNIHYKGILKNFTNGYHKSLEKFYNSNHTFSKVLEIGGGTGEHLPFVKHSFEEYLLLDIVENEEALSHIQRDPRNGLIKFVLADACSIPLPDNSLDRIVATCVLHHIPNVETAISELRRVAKNYAVINLYLPCDPGMMYRWVRHWTSHFKQKRAMKLSWGEVKFLWATEHRNHYLGIYKICELVFDKDEVKIRRYPLPFTSWNFSLYSILTIKINKAELV